MAVDYTEYWGKVLSLQIRMEVGPRGQRFSFKKEKKLVTTNALAAIRENPVQDGVVFEMKDLRRTPEQANALHPTARMEKLNISPRYKGVPYPTLRDIKTGCYRQPTPLWTRARLTEKNVVFSPKPLGKAAPKGREAGFGLLRTFGDSIVGAKLHIWAWQRLTARQKARDCRETKHQDGHGHGLGERTNPIAPVSELPARQKHLTSRRRMGWRTSGVNVELKLDNQEPWGADSATQATSHHQWWQSGEGRGPRRHRDHGKAVNVQEIWAGSLWSIPRCGTRTHWAN
ncbi:hypothetical protein CIRG_06336 [Coccidioides immitis RMSCC 2394]|uniref:Uncharacterized protein n=1 Tax=Coccidioides immitis RMSCC 2394 TaxID=404692 RepID=A0A0J6YD74_COCIT|nr:hypothetical protein CIRG_06336 [Coccidioides immitis RMSCC 2394]